MEFDTIRKTLSYAADHLGCQIFETKEFNDSVHQALDESKKWHKRDCFLNAPLVMRFVFLLMLYRSLSIVNILKKLLQQFRYKFTDLPLNAITPEATCHARSRLGAEPMRILFETQAAKIKPFALFKELKVWSVDGTSFNIPDTPANEARYGRPKTSPGKSAYPQMEAIMLTETSARQIKAVDFTPCDSSERAGVAKMLDKLGSNDLLLMDRGIPAAWLFAECQKRSMRFLARIPASWKPKFVEKLGNGDSIVTVEGNVPKERRKDGKTKVKLKLRMIRYKIDNSESEVIRLLTNLLDPDKYPVLEVAELYHSRWECELAYDEMKNHLGSRASGTQDLLFRSKSPDGVLQEAYALVILYNIIRGLMVESGRLYNVNPLEISFIETVQIIKDTTFRFQSAATGLQRLNILVQMLKDIAQCRNPRPRRQRQYPRAVKKKKNKYDSRRKDYCQKFIEHELKLVG